MDNSKQQPTSIPQTEQEWRTRLTPEQYEVLRNKGTEQPFTGAYASTKEPGVYRCAGCGAPLFSSTTKYESGTGWPSFWEPIEARGRRAARRPDPLDASHGGHLCAMRRPSGARVLRRTPADGGSLLHELGLAGTRAGAARGVGDRPEPPGPKVRLKAFAEPDRRKAAQGSVLQAPLPIAPVGLQAMLASDEVHPRHEAGEARPIPDPSGLRPFSVRPAVRGTAGSRPLG